jgi:peroxiredoxin
MIRFARSAALALALAAPCALAANVGQPAPEFSLPDVSGKTVSLSGHRGRFVVLEWVNPGCPYVRKHYDSANMPRLQKEFGAREVVWLAINSTNPGHYDFLPPQKLQAWMRQNGALPAATLMDTDGKVGRLYGARTTPHMYIIDPKGELIYAGAIDDKRSTNPEDVKTAKNHVRAALGEALAGKPVSTPSTAPYGCTVKY